MSVKIECILECDNHLGEGPVWDVEEGRLYWLDCTGPRFGKKAVWRMDPKTGKVENWDLPKDIGAMALREKGGAVAFYLADTFIEEFWAYDYDIETGGISNKRVLASTKDDEGVADGSTIDEEGYMWNAQLISGDLVRYAPDGSIERRIGMPVKNITSVMFGGDNLDVLYVTSMARVKHPAVHDMFAKQAKPQFLAGSLFAVTGLGIRGLPEPRFGG